MVNLFSNPESRKSWSYREWKFCLTSASAGPGYKSWLLSYPVKAKATFIFSQEKPSWGWFSEQMNTLSGQDTPNGKGSLLKAQKYSNTNLRPSDNKTPARLKVINSLLIQVFCRDNSFDHAIPQGSAHILQRNGFVVLHRYHNGVHTHGDDCSMLLDILNRDLHRTGSGGKGKGEPL